MPLSRGFVERQQALAGLFRALHHGPETLVLGSVWDVASAVVFQRAGFAALGTSSAGVAFSEGYPDGEQISRDTMLMAVQRIVRCVQIPVSADMEAGFGATPEAVAETCLLLLETGAVGVNLEDSNADSIRKGTLTDFALQVEKIRVVRAKAQRFGVELFINARTDAHWLNLWDEETRTAESIRRGQAYLHAGADGVFVPGVCDPNLIGALVGAFQGPLNVLATPGCPPVSVLRRLGVRRVSQGSGPSRACLALTMRIASELRELGTYAAFQQESVAYPKANALFAALGPSRP